MPDALFDDPRFARLYDPLDPDRSDLDAYLAMAQEFGAHTVLDVGCGTGTFACLLAEHGYDVVGVDPAGASLDVARGKSYADSVHWIHGDATPPLATFADTLVLPNGETLHSTSTLRFRTRVEVEESLDRAGFAVDEVRDAPDRPGREFVFVARAV